MIDPALNSDFGIYIHWPFCASKCPYCDFNSHVQTVENTQEWATALVSELDRYYKETSYSTVNSVFFGGGTPSLMPPQVVETVLKAIDTRWSVTPDTEITLEANPNSVEASRFAGYRAAGVNRISIGLQALNDESLHDLGRLHTVSEGLSALEIAQNIFDRVSFDLIYARQNQTPEEWHEELSRALAFGTSHMSLYQLTIEAGTAFGRLHDRGKLLGLPNEDIGVELYEITQELCGAQGIPAYEVSNHAKPGEESRHNLIYWRGGDYIGVGPGAHGRISVNGQRLATDTHLEPNKWLTDAVNGSGEASREVLNQKDQAIEYIMMALRLNEGLYISVLSHLGVYQDIYHVFKELEREGVVKITNAGYAATPRGRLILNTIISKLVLAIS